jgi:hypothetical protein
MTVSKLSLGDLVAHCTTTECGVMGCAKYSHRVGLNDIANDKSINSM